MQFSEDDQDNQKTLVKIMGKSTPGAEDPQFLIPEILVSLAQADLYLQDALARAAGLGAAVEQEFAALFKRCDLAGGRQAGGAGIARITVGFLDGRKGQGGEAARRIKAVARLISLQRLS